MRRYHNGNGRETDHMQALGSTVNMTEHRLKEGYGLVFCNTYTNVPTRIAANFGVNVVNAG